MDSSNVDFVTTGDVEAQQHNPNPNWFADHKHMLRPNQEGGVNKLGYFILKVPECRRQPPQAFSPQAWRFGLHNRENLDSGGSEAIKLDIAVRYGLVGGKWDHFCDAIVDDPKAMLACYGLQNEVTSWTDENIKHVLALDALFFATYIDYYFPENESRLWTLNRFTSGINVNDGFLDRYETWVTFVCEDLFRVENQIPFVLIEKVVDYMCTSRCTSSASQTSIDNVPPIADGQYQQSLIKEVVMDIISNFMDDQHDAFESGNSRPFADKTHILGVAYQVICGSKGLHMMQVKTSANICIPAATKLKQSGIKIVGVPGPLCTMSYTKKCLRLPKMIVYDETVSFIRNMAWYESNTISGGCLFNNYIFLMTDLIQAPEDLDLLIKHGAIDNTCGIKGFEMWSALKEGVVQKGSSKIHHDMKKAIKSRCNLRRYRLWSEFKIIFCSKPWLVLSTIVVVLVTMATLVQTYIAVIGFNEMKPNFP